MTERNRSGAELAGMVAAAGRDARYAAARARLQAIRLTDEDRRVVVDEVSEQFAIGRLDEDQLHRRVDVVNEAVTHADLQPALDGLPPSALYLPQPRQTLRWRWLGFAGAVVAAVPFVLLGLVLLLFGREVAAAIFGVPALGWVFFTYRWASRPQRDLRRTARREALGRSR